MKDIIGYEVDPNFTLLNNSLNLMETVVNNQIL